MSGLPSRDSEAGAKSPAFVYSVNKAFFTVLIQPATSLESEYGVESCSDIDGCSHCKHRIFVVGQRLSGEIGDATSSYIAYPASLNN